MDPMKRKLFQSRDARDKLRAQGGITASFPKLAETVAKFANGGPTELQIPRVRSAIQENGMSYPSYRMLGRSQKRGLGYPVSEIGGQMAFDRFGVGVGIVDPMDRFTPSGLNVSDTLPSSVGRRATRIRPDTEGTGENMPRLIAGRNPRNRPMPAETDMDRLARESAEEAARLREEQGITDARESIGAAIAAGDEEEEALRLADATDEQPAAATDEQPVADTDPARTGAAIGAGDFDTTFDQMLSRLERIMGEDSDEDKKKKAMANLAMIGLAIAAGQSPDALTNIAQGALVGMKGIQEAEADKRKTARDLRLAALEATMEQESEIRKAETAAAKSELQFKRDLSLEEAKARLRAKYESSGRNPRALEDFVQNTFNTALKAAQENPPADMQEGETPIAYATRIADQAGMQQQIRFPETYGISPAIKSRVDSLLKSNTDPAEIKRQLEQTFPGIDTSLYGL